MPQSRGRRLLPPPRSIPVCTKPIGKNRELSIDAPHHTLTFDAAFPLGILVHEHLTCIPLAGDRCRVTYGCNFTFSNGWRGRLMQFLLRSELDNGPADSLSRLQKESERLWVLSTNAN